MLRSGFFLLALAVLFTTMAMMGSVLGHQRFKRGGFTGHGGYGNAGGYAYSSDLLIGSGVGGNLAYDAAQRNFFSLNAADLGNAFDVGDSAHAIAKATRTSAAAGSKFKGGYGRR